ncbi:rhomboid family intramembrane serine protease [Neorhodopirellula pilleata]|uniref:Rhomboid family protein n=1 Tax=Neorhodopirellula pilleata TaxID=2714738 RepID=A0A5C5ZHW9_9BACT|nr:rhomboid family intramembrane serine protease [Neorhodopirellula pilleata]TWT86954.1 Rhomboid family protein [Neorhodopirellula pilleata]
MLFFPLSTDAPVYHWPIATVTLIVLNIAAFCGTSMQVYYGHLDLEQIHWLNLTFEQIDPLQWITQSFMHINPFDFLINMLFLWSFGLVIEGKVGAFWFTAIYFGTHLICAALAQTIFYSLSFAYPPIADWYTSGADNGIYALLAMALIWAPENEMTCVFVVLVPRMGKMGGGFVTEFKIASLATGFLFIQLVLFFFLGPLVWQAGFHLLSMIMGGVLAMFMLRREWVDCEDWDIVARNEWLHPYPLFCSKERRVRLAHNEDIKYDPVTVALSTTSSPTVSHAAYMAARSGSMSRTTKGQRVSINQIGKSNQNATQGTSNSPASARQQEAQSHPEFNRTAMLLRQAISQNSLMLANQHFNKLVELQIADGLSDQTLFSFVKLSASNKDWISVMRLLQMIVAHNGAMAMDARIRIAQLQLKVLHQPNEAIKTLNKVQFQPPAGKKGEHVLSEAQQKLITQRDALLKQCGAAPPYTDKPDAQRSVD